MTRGDMPVGMLMMRPKFGEFWLVFGVPRFSQLNALNASIRTCSLVRPPAGNILCSPRSTFLVPGPRRLLRLELPKVPSAFGEYAEVSNHCRTFSDVGRSDGRSGLPDRSARWPPVPVRALSAPLVTVKPPPLCIERMPVSDHSLSRPATTRLSNAPGTCQRNDVTQRCLRSAFA